MRRIDDARRCAAPRASAPAPRRRRSRRCGVGTGCGFGVGACGRRARASRRCRASPREPRRRAARPPPVPPRMRTRMPALSSSDGRLSSAARAGAWLADRRHRRGRPRRAVARRRGGPRRRRARGRRRAPPRAGAARSTARPLAWPSPLARRLSGDPGPARPADLRPRHRRSVPLRRRRRARAPRAAGRDVVLPAALRLQPRRRAPRLAAAGCACVSLHGRALERIVPHLQPGARLLALSWDGRRRPRSRPCSRSAASAARP